ncbi:MAG TPA: GNAT family N-acetyltransferase [Paracoccus sp. (in: a-proteobacteria)]|uniref:GNAT family N-acetyltransferase n=1 Tax=uncultured Paracoccus sp. TaxID=189685 RepID=UPI00260644E5|nr:GNAT family N-acetyltransferase [uncultured Paracoccus sp.]HMQ39971.1 GNAT family N-acetyltransferase [Paracoccus sp. (in: a-proteobacteria)]HMR37286.1 GNAT family N-acetyltransferase [Paracoccus sp. (in: a-proteobacteria)]
MRIEETEDLALCHALRRAVFIEEQGVSEAEEMDDLDPQAIHFLGWIDGRPVATARIFVEGETGKIGRVCVLAEARGTGAGLALMRATIAALRERGAKTAKLSSQTHAMPFYEKLGFVAYGSEYPDAGIPHRDMVLEL